MRRLFVLLAASAAAVLPALAQQQPPPPKPYELTTEERRLLDEKKAALAERLRSLPADAPRRADAEVFIHTAEMADRLRLYVNKGHVVAVARGLEIGLQRSDDLARSAAPWARRPGRSLRGFVSGIDGTVQPYGVVLPAGFDPNRTTGYPLEVFLHGRGPTEVTFRQQHEPVPGTAAAKAPEQPHLELHPFGRGNNGWRWAGETDVFEALEQFLKQYPVDRNRIMLRGFSMGGHGAWHIGLHYPHVWSAVSPGAGFTDTRRYLKISQPAPEYQEKAWHIYDAMDYGLNLFNTPFIAYSGDKDPQLQASLNMREAAAGEGMTLNLILGPDTEHRYHPESLKEIMRQLASHRRDPQPRKVKYTTFTLKYNRCAWVTLDALQEHYRRAVVTANIEGDRVTVRTQNVAGLTLDPLPEAVTAVDIDGQRLSVKPGQPLHARLRNGKWRLAPGEKKPSLRKRHGLQGPIDDAFTERFVAVRGTGSAWSAPVQAYAERELRRFQDEWRFGFRGEVPLRDDTAVTAQDYADANLVLFGDPGSNRVLARILPRLPLRWTREFVEVNGRRYAPDHVPVLVYPNPLNPRRYVVINSGHTWARRDLLASNAYLTPKLPDWAVLRPGAERPGAERPEVVAADYFNEEWRFKREPKRD